MKTSRFIALILIPLLFACAPKKPESPMIEVPAGPLLHALEQRRQSFGSLKAVASVELTARGRKRAFDTVGVVLDGQRRFRMEGYGPLGQTIMVLVWDGRNVLLRLPDSDRVEQQAGLEQLLGEGVDARELSAALSGNIPEPERPCDAAQRCAQSGECVLELRCEDTVRRIRVLYPPSDPTEGPRIVSQELYRSGNLLYRALFDRTEAVSTYRLPMKIQIENPDRRLLLTIEYSDVEMNAPINDEDFTLTDTEAGGKQK